MALPPLGSKSFLAILGFALAVEGALYSAVTPILPMLSRRLDMSDTQAGIMLSSYSSGIVAGSLVCVLVLRRVDPRSAAVGAMASMALFTVVFAWAGSYEVALGARLIQGIVGGATWTACITWLLRLWPIERRGEALGLAIGPAVVGTIAGPAIGTTAIEFGVRGPYTLVGALCAAAAVWLLRMPRPAVQGDLEDRRVGASNHHRRMALLGAYLVTVGGALIGLINLAGPLVLVGLGAADRTGGVVFVIAAVVTVSLARPLGTLVDRGGAIRMAVVGMLAMAMAFPVFGAGPGVYATAFLIVLLVVANNLCYISAGALLTREGQGAGWSLYFVIALTATVWGLGETVGAMLAGVGLDKAGPLWTTGTGSVIAAGMVAAIFAVSRTRERAKRAPSLKDGHLRGPDILPSPYPDATPNESVGDKS
jgi:predicted MFS family arabinose efflux permease